VPVKTQWPPRTSRLLTQPLWTAAPPEEGTRQWSARRRMESCHQPVTTALRWVARPQTALWAWGPRTTVSTKESGVVQYYIGRMRDWSPTAVSPSSRDFRELCEREDLLGGRLLLSGTQVGLFVVGPGAPHRSWTILPDATLCCMILDGETTGTTSVLMF